MDRAQRLPRGWTMAFTEIVNAAHRVERWLRRMRQPLDQTELDRAERDAARPLDAGRQQEAEAAARHALRGAKAEGEAAE